MDEIENNFDVEQAKKWLNRKDKSFTAFLIKRILKMGFTALLLLSLVQLARVMLNPDAFSSHIWLEELVAEVVGILSAILIFYAWDLYKRWHRNNYLLEKYLNKHPTLKQ